MNPIVVVGMSGEFNFVCLDSRVLVGDNKAWTMDIMASERY